MYAILKECRAISQTCHKDHALMSDIYIRLEDTFELTQEQKVPFPQFYFLMSLTIV